MTYNDEERKYDDIFEADIKPDMSVTSDIIVFCKNMSWHNLTTGASNTCLERVTRYSTRNIIFSQVNCSDARPGYLLEYNEKHDVLVVFYGTINLLGIKSDDKREWQDVQPVAVIERDGKVIFPAKENSKSKLSPHLFDANLVDMCAETIYDGTNQYRLSVKQMCIYTHTNDMVKEFLGTKSYPVIKYYSYGYPIETTIDNPVVWLDRVNRGIDKDLTTEMQELLSYELPEIRKAEMLTFFATERDEDTSSGSVSACDNIFQYHMYSRSISYVQHVTDGVSVIRMFTACVKVRKPFTRITADDIEEEEVFRIYVSRNREPICVRKYFAKWIPSELIELNSFFAPWTKEDVVGTSLALFDENIREGFEVLKGADKDEKDREIQIGLHEKSFCKTICSVISHPYAQSIAESNLQNIKAVIQDSLISRSFEMTLFNLFLISEDAKWNHAYGVNALKAENIPAHMLQTFDEIIGMYKKYPRQTSHGSVIIKNLFTTIEEMFRSRLDYLRNMNKEQYRDIAMSIAKWSIESSSHSIYFCTSDLSSVVDTLINLCGPKNVKAYIKHFFTLYEKVSALAFQKYMDYLVMCNKLRATLDGDRCPAVNWKETDEEKISQMHDEVMVLYNQVSDEAMIANTKEKFEKVSKKWDDYDYKENKFSVIMPENVLDILRESNELSHCVKSYIDPVLEGKTNIFFIRRTSDLAKPFFTLEVRNNEVRQCHGFANKNIDTEEGLEDFLTRYCKEKNINFNKKDVIRVLGA